MQNIVANKLLNHRRWLLSSPATSISSLKLGHSSAVLRVVRDDLLHSLWGGNKGRKLDALLPEVVFPGAHVLAYGGLQSAHLSSVSAAVANLGGKTHLLIRGERPQISTGHHLIASQYASSISYITRSEYSNRTAMVASHKERLQTELGAEVSVIEEGGFQPAAILGFVRLVCWLSSSIEGLSESEPCDIVIDSGTGTSAIGFAAAISILKLPWRVFGVMLAGSEDYYREQEKRMLEMLQASDEYRSLDLGSCPIEWVPRPRPRKFGGLLPGDVEMCRQVAGETGMIMDPIWSLASYEQALVLSKQQPSKQVVMYHSGASALTIQGLAQRFPASFNV
jgi:D-cysteine desulfhydrase